MKNKTNIFKRLWNILMPDLQVKPALPQPIELSNEEKRWIKLCKGHYKEATEGKNWIEALQPMFNLIYGWSADEFYNDFLDCMFQKLLDLHLKIQNVQSGSNAQLKLIFKASFNKGYSKYELPIERAIAALCSEIQFNIVLVNGVRRYNLDIKEPIK